MITVRYTDDFVLGFQYRDEAETFLEHLREHMAEYELDLHPKKARLIEFGRFAAGNRKREGEGKPETFNFLGRPQAKKHAQCYPDKAGFLLCHWSAYLEHDLEERQVRRKAQDDR